MDGVCIHGYEGSRSDCLGYTAGGGCNDCGGSTLFQPPLLAPSESWFETPSPSLVFSLLVLVLALPCLFVVAL